MVCPTIAGSMRRTSAFAVSVEILTRSHRDAVRFPGYPDNDNGLLPSTLSGHNAHNPGYDDELGHRERKLAALLCTPCGSSGNY